MFKTLKAIMFGLPQDPVPTHSVPQDDVSPPPRRVDAAGTLFADRSPFAELMDPGNPIGLTSAASPLHPCSPLW